MCNPTWEIEHSIAQNILQAVEEMPCSGEIQLCTGLMYQREGDCPAGDNA